MLSWSELQVRIRKADAIELHTESLTVVGSVLVVVVYCSCQSLLRNRRRRYCQRLYLSYRRRCSRGRSLSRFLLAQRQVRGLWQRRRMFAVHLRTNELTYSFGTWCGRSRLVRTQSAIVNSHILGKDAPLLTWMRSWSTQLAC